MVSAIITAAGKNRRMSNDQKTRGLNIQPKLLLDLHGKPVIIKTLDNVKNTGVEELVIVLGYFSDEIRRVLIDYLDVKIKIIVNPNLNVKLSDTLLNGARNVKSGLCLCAAADQPTVSTDTLNNLINALNSEKNMVTILARGKSGYLNSTKGLGMPFVCHSKLLKKYLPGKEDNLNPILNNMLEDGVIFYGVNTPNSLEKVNINRWDDYITVLKETE
ncbi:MAG: NTP transferase domain-containing protein [Methanobacterium sp.]